MLRPPTLGMSGYCLERPEVRINPDGSCGHAARRPLRAAHGDECRPGRLRPIPSLRCQETARADAPSGIDVLFAHGCDETWWSQPGSNRRPQACKASALPTELWPRFRRLRTPNPPTGPARAGRVVGLGRFELPTSRLSSARSNQLSYRPASVHP
jgi:hypothetical protein